MRHVSRAWPAPTNQNTPMPPEEKNFIQKKKKPRKKKTQRTPEPPENPDCSVLTPAVSFPVHLAGGARARSLVADNWPTAAAALRQVPRSGRFACDEQPPGIGTAPPSLPFLLCETEHPNPSLKLSGCLCSDAI